MGVLRGIDTLIWPESGGKVSFLRKLDQREYVYTLLQGFGKSAKDYDVRIENHHTGAAGITSDRPVAKIMFWANPMVYCASLIYISALLRARHLPGRSITIFIPAKLNEDQCLTNRIMI